jgi:chromosome segregation ATPase
MKASASAQDSTVPIADQALTLLPISAQQQIEALRAAIDVRLAALDAVLADPSRGESLEALILDLARLATEEARASATRACVGIKLEADNEIAQIRKSAQQSLEHERIVSSDFRRSLEQAQQRSAALERDRQTELRTLHDQFESKLASDRTALDASERAVANLERALADARNQIDTERAASAALLDDVARIESQAAVAARDQAEARTKVAQAEQAAEQNRQRAAETARAHGATQAELATERAAIAELRGAIERLRGQAATADRDREDAKKASATIGAELARERQIAATLEQRLREAAQLLEAERTTAVELRQAIARAEEHGVALGREQAEAHASSKSVAAALERERQAVADLGRAQEGLTSQLDAERQLTRELRASLTKLEQRLSVADQEASLQSAGQDELRDALLAARGSAQTLHDDLENERKASKTLRRRLDEVESRISRADKDAAHHAASQEELRQALATARNERQLLTTALEAEQKAAAELRGRLDQAGQQLGTAKADAATLATARQTLATTQADVERLRADVLAGQETIEQQTRDIERLTRQLTQSSNEAATQDELRLSLAQSHADARRLQTELEAERQAARKLHAEHERLELQIERATNAAAHSEQQAVDLARAADELTTLRDQLEVERSATRELRVRLDDLEGRLSRANDETVQHANGSEEMRETIRSARADAQTLRQEVETERRQAGGLRRELDAALQQIQDAARAAETQLTEQIQVEQTLAASLTEHEKLVANLETERTKVQDLERTRAAADAAWREAEEKLEDATRERDRLATALANAEAGLRPAPAQGGSARNRTAAPAAASEPVPAPAPNPAPVVAAAPAAKPAHGKEATAYAVSDDGWTQVRMTRRYAFRDRMEIGINTGSGWLSDLSIGGCQLLSRTALKPKQSVKITLPCGDKGLLCSGKVIWARVEPPTAGQPLSYRAGVQFSNADQAAIEAFLAGHGIEI